MMRCLFHNATLFIILCWTTSKLRAQQMSQETDQGVDKSSRFSYFFYQHPEYSRDCQEVQDGCSSNHSSGVYMIKPDGYSEPFEVYCENQNSDSWTVILRRTDGSLQFNRNWDSYTVGFGFLSHEFWIGNEKLSHLTNQKEYELQIEMTKSDGSRCYINYNLFRISDEFGNFKLTNLGQYSGTANECFRLCPGNMEYGNCSCEHTCEDPLGCHTDSCIDVDGSFCTCPAGYYVKEDECVPPEECGCHVSGEGVIPEGGFYIDSSCSRKAQCSNGQLIWDETYSCDANAVCEERNNVRQCYCNEGYEGDGLRCTADFTNCLDVYNAGHTTSGVYNIKPTNWPTNTPFQVYCNMTGGAWTVFQHREDGSVDFYKSWQEYKQGFGSVDHEFWLGNEKLYYLTSQGRYILRIDLVDRHGTSFYAIFDNFQINSETDKYRLAELGTYSGNADEHSDRNGYALRYHLNQPFSTYDQDNDAYSYNCAVYNHGAWWYKNCFNSNLNGDYHATTDNPSIRWNYLPDDGVSNNAYLKFTEMKARPF